MKLIDVLRGAGWSESELGNALGVISLESGGNTNAHNTSGEDSRGLFQLNVGPGAHIQWANLDLYDPAVNASYAYQLFTWAGNWRDWWNAAGILGLPPRGTYRHAVSEFQALADKEMGSGSGGNGTGDSGDTGGKSGWLVLGAVIVLALIVRG